MSLTPPAGYGIHARTYRPDGGSRTAVNVWGFRNVSSAPIATVHAAAGSAMSGGGKPYNLGNLALTWKSVQSYTLINIGGVLTSSTSISGSSGTLAIEPVPPATSMVVRKITGVAGRAYRGRIALPGGFIDEPTVDEAGILDAGVVTAFQTTFDAMLAQMNTSNIPVYLLHGPNLLGVTPVPTLVSSILVTNLVGSQRRRLRR